MTEPLPSPAETHRQSQALCKGCVDGACLVHGYLAGKLTGYGAVRAPTTKNCVAGRGSGQRDQRTVFVIFRTIRSTIDPNRGACHRSAAAAGFRDVQGIFLQRKSGNDFFGNIHGRRADPICDGGAVVTPASEIRNTIRRGDQVDGEIFGDVCRTMCHRSLWPPGRW